MGNSLNISRNESREGGGIKERFFGSGKLSSDTGEKVDRVLLHGVSSTLPPCIIQRCEDIYGFKANDHTRHEVELTHPTVIKLLQLEDRFSCFPLELKKLSKICVLEGGYIKIGGYLVKTSLAHTEQSGRKGIYEHSGFSVFDANGVKNFSSELKEHRIPTKSELDDILDHLPGKDLFLQGNAALKLFNLPKISIRQPKILSRLLSPKIADTCHLRTLSDDCVFSITEKGIKTTKLSPKQACPVLLIKNID